MVLPEAVGCRTKNPGEGVGQLPSSGISWRLPKQDKLAENTGLRNIKSVPTRSFFPAGQHS